MITTIRILLILLIIPELIYCQGESNNWYFGFGAGVHFNRDGSVNALIDGQLNTYEGCASISDKQGNLLFYTDGKTVYNRQHNIMVNGQDLFGQPSSTQSAIIVPKPDNGNIYYIITTNSQLGENPNNGLNYTEVDMSLNSGNGEVTLKNIKLLKDTVEKAAVIIKDCASNSLWLIALGTNLSGNRIFNTFHAFEINDSGIILPSIQSTVSDMSAVEGYLKFSLDGKKIASASMSSGLFLYDFDTTTGIVSNEQEIVINAQENTNAYGIEFSPNSNLLYVHASNNWPLSTGHTASLFQYDLQANDISASQIILDQSRNLYRAALQLGPNGKIYRSLTETYDRGISFLGVINNPNESGSAAQYEHNAVSLNGRLAAQGLPAFVQSFFRKVDITSNEIILSANNLELCENEELSLEATYFPEATYTWEKDTIEIEGEINNVLIVSNIELADAGHYQVTVYLPGAEACPLLSSVNVLVHSLPEVSPTILTVCDDALDTVSNGMASFNLEQVETDTGLVYTYYESKQDMTAESPIATPQTYTNTKPFNQFVYYTVANARGCENLGEIQLQVAVVPMLTLEPIYRLCTDNPTLKLEGPANYDSYAWYKIDTTSNELVSSVSVIEIVDIGFYRLVVGDNYMNIEETLVCERFIEFEVVATNRATIQDVIINDNNEVNTIEIIAVGYGDYEYSINATDYQNSNYFENVPSGTITVYVQDRNGCGVTEQRIEVDPNLVKNNFPKFFTPNGDGVNDFWQYIPDSSGDINVLSIEIYNRMGQLLIQLNPNSKGWDGSFNGSMLHATDYWFKAISINQQVIQGHFSLMR